MSLRVLHTSDWHLGKIFKETSFDLLPIQKQALQEIVEISSETKPDIALIAGDIFDTYNPSFEAERLFYETITKLSKNNCFVIVIAGNHDSPEKLQISKPLLVEKHPIFIVTNPLEDFSYLKFENENLSASFEGLFLKLKLKNKNKIVAIKVLPYLSEVRLGLSADEFIGKIYDILLQEPQFTCDEFLLLGHMLVSGAQKSGSERILIGGIESIPLECLPEKANYIALGHLHKHQKIRNAVYSGSIYPFDVTEIQHEKGVCILENKSVKLIEFKKVPKIKKLEFDTIEDAIRNAPDDEHLYYIIIKAVQPYTLVSIEKLLKKYKNRLVNWQFSIEEKEIKTKIPDITSLSDEEIFKNFFKTKLNTDPSEDLVKIFLETLEEVRNAAN